MLQIVDSAVDLVEGIAIDWVGRNIYWTDYILEVIEVIMMKIPANKINIARIFN